MRKLTILAAAMLSTTMVTPAFADGHLRITDEPVELTVHLHNKRYFYDSEWPVEQAARALTGVSLIGETFGTNTPSSSEAHNLMLASGDMPHIVGGDKIKDMVNEYGPQGAFVPLNDLIAEHAPNMKAYFEKYPEKWLLFRHLTATFTTFLTFQMVSMAAPIGCDRTGSTILV